MYNHIQYSVCKVFVNNFRVAIFYPLSSCTSFLPNTPTPRKKKKTLNDLPVNILASAIVYKVSQANFDSVFCQFERFLFNLVFPDTEPCKNKFCFSQAGCFNFRMAISLFFYNAYKCPEIQCKRTGTYSVTQWDSFNNASRDEDNILDQI